MTTSILRYFTKVRPLLNLFSAALFVIAAVELYQLSDEGKKIATLNDGVGTCFSRVKQSYTAYALADLMSDHLGSSFLQTTEECFSEAMIVARREIGARAKETTRRLNSALTELRWFHEALGNKEITDTKEAFATVSKKFEGVESLILDTVDEIREASEANQKELDSSKTNTFILVFLFPLLLILEFTSQRKRVRGNDQLEREASIELTSMDSPASARIDDLISRALNNNGLFYLKDLFTRYHGDVLEKKISIFSERKAEKNTPLEVSEKRLDFAVPIKKDLEENQVIINESTNLPTGVSVEQVFGTVIDLLAEKLFTQGVALDVDIDSNLYLDVDHEALQQIFFNLLVASINRSLTTDSRRISVIATRDTAEFFTISDNGVGNGVDFDNDSSMMIATAFAKELGLNLSITGTQTGSTVNLIKEVVTTAKPKLTMVRKGKKSELLKEFQ